MGCPKSGFSVEKRDLSGLDKLSIAVIRLDAEFCLYITKIKGKS